MTPKRVAVLFARRDSIYKVMRGCNVSVWDEDRDALKWPGGCPVIAHPPCRAWGGLRHMAKPAAGERELALFALAQVRKWGGVLEHPRRSELWPQLDLPMGDEVDEHGGYSLLVNQAWWGHLAEKPSLLYVCGVARRDIPPVIVDLRAPSHIVGGSGRRRDGTRLGWRPDLSRRLREATPRDFAMWLIRLARAARPAAASSARSGRVTPAAHGRAARAVSGAVRGRLDHRVTLSRSASTSGTAQRRADPHGVPCRSGTSTA